MYPLTQIEGLGLEPRYFYLLKNETNGNLHKLYLFQ